MDARGSLAKFIRWVMQDTTYHRLYPSTVEGQASDGSLDLLPDDESIRGNGLSAVPIWHGLPGVTVRVPNGERVLLGFRNGDPTQPYAALWEPGSVDSIEIAGSGPEVARKGDTVEVLLPPAIFTGTIVIGGTPSPASGVMSFTANKTSGSIITGSPKLKVGI